MHRRRVNYQLAQLTRQATNAAYTMIMEADPAFADGVARMAACTDTKPCNRAVCPKCGLGLPKPKSKRPAKQNSKNSTAANLYPYSGGTKQTNPVSRYGRNHFRARAGRWMADLKSIVDPRCISMVTINSFLGDGLDDPKKIMKDIRRGVRSIVENLGEESEIRVLVQVTPVHCNAVYSSYPDDAVACSIMRKGFPDIPGFLYHSHGVLCHPWHTRDQVREILKKMFPGKQRIDVKPITKKADNGGTASGGIEGWGEYASDEVPLKSFKKKDRYGNRVSPEFEDDYDIADALMKIGETVSRQARKVSACGSKLNPTKLLSKRLTGIKSSPPAGNATMIGVAPEYNNRTNASNDRMAVVAEDSLLHEFSMEDWYSCDPECNISNDNGSSYSGIPQSQQIIANHKNHFSAIDLQSTPHTVSTCSHGPLCRGTLHINWSPVFREYFPIISNVYFSGSATSCFRPGIERPP